MTIERARELLGDEAVNLTDEEILSYLKATGLLCDSLFEVVEKDLLNGKIPKD